MSDLAQSSDSENRLNDMEIDTGTGTEITNETGENSVVNDSSFVSNGGQVCKIYNNYQASVTY